MLSRGLQRSSPHREPRTSQILTGITPSFAIFPPSFHVLSLKVWLSLNPLFSSSPSTCLYHFSPRPPLDSCSSSIVYISDTRPLAFFSAPTSPLSISRERKKTQKEKLRESDRGLTWREGNNKDPWEDWLESFIGRGHRGGLVKRII